MRTIAAALLLALAACSGDSPRDPGVQVQQTLEVQRVDGPALERPQVDSPPPKDLRAVSVAPGGSSGRLGVFLLRRTAGASQDLHCLTLEEALKAGTLKITEKDADGEVNELRVENLGAVPVYLQAGDTVKGGKQDRTLAVDTLLPPKSGARALDAFCVEPGRWQVRADAAPGASTAAFTMADFPVTKGQALAAKLEKNQGKVWEEGRKVNAELARNAGQAQAADSYVLAAEDPKVKAQVDGIMAALKDVPASVPDAVGAAFCRDGRVQSIELYAGPALFRKLWPKLLRGAATETVGTPAPKEAAPPCSTKDVEALLASMEGQAGKAELRPDGQVVRVWDKKEAALFDTEAQGRLLHRQLLTK